MVFSIYWPVSQFIFGLVFASRVCTNMCTHTRQFVSINGANGIEYLAQRSEPSNSNNYKLHHKQEATPFDKDWRWAAVVARKKIKEMKRNCIETASMQLRFVSVRLNVFIFIPTKFTRSNNLRLTNRSVLWKVSSAVTFNAFKLFGE